MWRSLGLLLFKPGALTKAAWAGRRVSYVDPLRLFLFLSVIFFLAPDTWNSKGFELNPEWQIPVAQAESLGDRIQIGYDRFMEVQKGDSDVRDQLAITLARKYLTLYMIAGTLLLAFFLRMIKWKTFLSQHLVFALHYGCFVYLSNQILRTALWKVDSEILNGLVNFLVQIAYFIVAWQVIYGKPGFWLRSREFLLSLLAITIYGIPSGLGAMAAGVHYLMPPAS